MENKWKEWEDKWGRTEYYEEEDQDIYEKSYEKYK